MNDAEDYLRGDAMIIIKNPDQLDQVESHIKSSPSNVYAYMAFHTAIYLSPFLKDKEYFWDTAMLLITRRKRSSPVPKERLCLRLVDKVLPSLMMAAIEMTISSNPLSSQVMADVIAEEVRSAFIDQVTFIQRVDPWTRHILIRRAQNVGVRSFYSPPCSTNRLVLDLARTIKSEIGFTNPLEYFMSVSQFMGFEWATPGRHVLVQHSLFEAPAVDF
ncbi:uncharacterized protein LOC144168274 [Haemaphysalis longicornis]